MPGEFLSQDEVDALLRGVNGEEETKDASETAEGVRPYNLATQERIVRGRRQTISESLFPGYLFIQLAADANWAPLRSTRGVNRIVAFGGMPLRLDNSLIAHLQQRTATVVQPALEAGDSVRITQGGFAELDAIFVAMDGEQRVLMLLNMLNRQQQVSLPLVSIVKN